MRKGRENVPSDGLTIEHLLASRPTRDFEIQEVPESTRDDLDDDVIDEYLEKRQKRTPRSSIVAKDRLLQQIGALSDENIPTVSGMLLFGKDPQLFLPQSHAVFVKFNDVQPRGPESGFGYGRREEIGRPLLQIVDRV